MQAPARVGASSIIADGFSSLARPPFRGLAGLSILITLTSNSFGTEVTEVDIALSLALFVASVYLQIALTLAAGRPDVEPSVDLWLRGAVKRRCFWRFIGTSLLLVLALLTGALAFGVGLLFVGALVAMSQSAVVLERPNPMESLIRSARLSRGSRWAIGFVFALLVLAPTAATQLGASQGWPDSLGGAWYAILVASELCSAAGVIALTRAFVTLGGSPTPAPDRLGPAPTAVSR
jgi:hypothetical protein